MINTQENFRLADLIIKLFYHWLVTILSNINSDRYITFRIALVSSN